MPHENLSDGGGPAVRDRREREDGPPDPPGGSAGRQDGRAGTGDAGCVDDDGDEDANAGDGAGGVAAEEDDAEEGDGDGDPIPDYASKYQPPDPESKYPDPAEELPTVPEPPSPDPDEIPAGLRASFWWLVLVFNAAVLALWLGLLFVAFEGDYGFGGRLLFAGGVLFAYGYYRYRRASGKYD